MFCPRVRARALRTPVFFSSLPRQTGRCAPPRPSQLRCFLFDPQKYIKSIEFGLPEGVCSFNSTTEAREYTECLAFYPVVRIGAPHPLTCKRVLFPPPFGSKGGDTLTFGGGGGNKFRRWGIHFGTSMYTVHVLQYNSNPLTTGAVKYT